MITLAICLLAICLLSTNFALYSLPIAPLVITCRGKVHVASTSSVRSTIHILLTMIIILTYSKLGYLSKIEDYYHHQQDTKSINLLVEAVTDITSLTKTIEQRIKKHPSDHHAKYILSNLYKRQQSFTRAHNLLQEVVQAVPHNLIYSSALLEAEFNGTQALSDSSIDIAKRYVEKQCDTYILSMLAISLYKKKRYREARLYMRKLQKHLPLSSQAQQATTKLYAKIEENIADLPAEQ